MTQPPGLKGVEHKFNTSPNMDTMNTTFIKSGPGYCAGVKTQRDMTYDDGAIPQMVEEIMKRKVAAGEFEWTIGSTPEPFKFDPYDTFFSNFYVREKINNFAFVRCDLKVTMSFVATEYKSGLLTMHCNTRPDKDQFLVDTSEVSDWTRLCQNGYVSKEARHHDDVVLCVPFPGENNAFSVRSREWVGQSQISVRVLNELRTISDDVDPVTVRFIIEPEDLRVYGITEVSAVSPIPSFPTSRIQAGIDSVADFGGAVDASDLYSERTHVSISRKILKFFLGNKFFNTEGHRLVSKDEYDFPLTPCTVKVLETLAATPPPVLSHIQAGGDRPEGPISSTSAAIAAAAGALNSVPIIRPYTTIVQEAASGMAAAARFFGYSRPSDDSHSSRYYPDVTGGFSTAHSMDVSRPLALDPNIALTIDKSTMGMDNNHDPMSIASIASIQSYFHTFPWSPTDDNRVPLFETGVTPGIWRTVTGPGPTSVDNRVHFTAIGAAVAPAVAWRGTISFIFEAVCTPKHRGKLMITWDPNGFVNGITSDDLTETRTWIWDISNQTKMRIDVPMAVNRNFLRVDLPDKVVRVDQISDTQFVNVVRDNTELPFGNRTPSSNYFPSVVDDYWNGKLRVSTYSNLACPDLGSTIDRRVEINCYVFSNDLECNMVDTAVGNYRFFPPPETTPVTPAATSLSSSLGRSLQRQRLKDKTSVVQMSQTTFHDIASYMSKAVEDEPNHMFTNGERGAFLAYLDEQRCIIGHDAVVWVLSGRDYANQGFLLQVALKEAHEKLYSQVRSVSTRRRTVNERMESCNYAPKTYEEEISRRVAVERFYFHCLTHGHEIQCDGFSKIAFLSLLKELQEYVPSCHAAGLFSTSDLMEAGRLFRSAMNEVLGDNNRPARLVVSPEQMLGVAKPVAVVPISTMQDRQPSIVQGGFDDGKGSPYVNLLSIFAYNFVWTYIFVTGLSHIIIEMCVMFKLNYLLLRSKYVPEDEIPVIQAGEDNPQEANDEGGEASPNALMDTDATMNVTPTRGQAWMIYGAEPIVSVKELMNRSTFHSAFTPGSPGRVLFTRDSQPMPYHAGYAPGGIATANGEAYNPSHQTWLNFYSACYHRVRGGVKWKFRYVNPDGPNEAFGSMSATLSPSRLVYNEATNFYGNLANTPAFITGSKRSTLAGTEATTTGLNTMLAIVVPFRSISRFDFGRRANYTTETQEWEAGINLDVETELSNTSRPHIDSYVSAHTDFVCSQWAGLPIVYTGQLSASFVDTSG